MNFQFVLAGVILLGAMTAAGISVWIKRRKEQEQPPKRKA
jgi:hypothetical protein